MSFQYKNPISPNQLTGQQSIDRSKTYGTNYSILSTGGYMEVFSLDQLYYTIPPSTYGPIEYSGNSIPITFSKGSGTTFSLDTLTLHPDNISSGRRKLGMLVYVYEENQVYQFNIDNYETLWNSATGSTGTTIISDFGTTIKADSVENIAFISGWTANTIDGVSGETYSTAVWKKYYGNNLSITGGSYNTFTGTLTLTNITGGTQTLTGFGGGGGGSGITGGTFDKNTETLTLSSSGGSIFITGFTDVYTTGGTFNVGTNTLQLNDNSGNTISITGFSSTFTGNTSATCITDLYVDNLYGCSPISVWDNLTMQTGVTINSPDNLLNLSFDNGGVGEFKAEWNDTNSNSKITIGNNILNLDIQNFLTSESSSLSFQPSVAQLIYNTSTLLSINSIANPSSTSFQLRGEGEILLEGAYNQPGNTSIILQDGFLQINSPITQMSNDVYIISGLTASTISASTYQNLPTDIRVTGGTYSNGTATFTNNTGGTFNVSGFFTGSTDVFVTGATYLNNTFTFTNNTGGTFNTTFNTMTGLTATTISASTYQNLPPNYGSFGLTIDGGGSDITTGNKGYAIIPYNGTITGWNVIGNTSGSCVIDVWKTTSGNIPTSGDTITGTEKPTLSSQQINSDLNLTTWTTSVSQYDVIGFNVDSTSGLTRVNLSIYITKQ